MLSLDERRRLHGQRYVQRYEEFSTYRLERLLPLFNVHHQDRVLDIGCGNGLLAAYLAPKVKTYTGVDFSEEFIEASNRRKARLELDNCTFVCADLNDFCRAHTDSFDAAFAMDFVEHVYDDDLLGIFVSVRNALRSGSKLYLHTPNAGYFLEIMKSHNFVLRQFPEHVAVRDSSAITMLLRQAGFSNIRTRFLPHYNFLRYLHAFSYIPLVGDYFKARLFITAMT